MNEIKIQGARTHNLKNITIRLPRDRLIVVTGLSGSGKSSLAFDTLYAEGQRRYVESLSAYARQFLSVMDKPEVDSIEGLSPAISIEQKSTSHNPRSTVGTITEIYDYLRVLYARVGEARCPEHDVPLKAQTVSQMVDGIMALPQGTSIAILAPVLRHRKGEHAELIKQLIAQGFVRARLDGVFYDLAELPKLSARKKHALDVVVDRLRVQDDSAARLSDSCATALKLSDGLIHVLFLEDEQKTPLTFCAHNTCPECGYNVPELEPRLFSFNTPVGACPSCKGIGSAFYMDPKRFVRPELSLLEGAFPGWDRNHSHFTLLERVCRQLSISLLKPFGSLPEDEQKFLLYGMDEAPKRFQGYWFDGVVAHMERRYRETHSENVRDSIAQYFSNLPCNECAGSRLKREARHVFIEGTSLPDLTALSIDQAYHYCSTLTLEGQRGVIAERLLREISARLKFLMEVGLSYLSLSRSAETLSGGEAQRIRLASQIGSGLMGVMYVLDEPSIGLHSRDNTRLLKSLFRLRDLGNTVIVVEHDEEAMRSADHLVDIGPGAGIHGGHLVAQGTPEEVMASKQSLTGAYLRGEKYIPVPSKRVPVDPSKTLKIVGACGNNLKNVDVEFPLGLMICVTGVSGSGKSTLINETLYPVAARALNGAYTLVAEQHERVDGLGHLDKVIAIDQSPIGRTPRSNPATYTGIFTTIRELFSETPEAKICGYEPGRFSFNVPGGRCEACEGDGMIRVEMHFLSDAYVQCDQCKGRRYNRETLQVRYKDRNIHEVLEMTVEEAENFFSSVPVLQRRLRILMEVGLGYIKLGQSATTLSGGEAQRIKLSKELAKRDTGKTLYILDEPTTGLHIHDIAHLLDVLTTLRDRGNTLVVIEHHMDVIKTADWVIDLGPEGGAAGGEVIAVGTPEQLVKSKASHTGQYLKPVLQEAKRSKKTSKETV